MHPRTQARHSAITDALTPSAHRPRPSPDRVDRSFLEFLGGGVIVGIQARVHGLTWMQIADIRANVDDQGDVDRWQVTVDISFKVDDA